MTQQNNMYDHCPDCKHKMFRHYNLVGSDLTMDYAIGKCKACDCKRWKK